MSNPSMGPGVCVTNLWDVRDFWEWLWPGHRANKAEALCHGGIAFYEKIAGYHDFELRRDVSEPRCPKVMLWAKRYMYSPTYELIGTPTTWAIDKELIKRMPRGFEQGVSKAENAAESLNKLEKLSTGAFKTERSPARLAFGRRHCNLQNKASV